MNTHEPIHRAPEIDFTLESSGEIQVYSCGAALRLGPHGLALLDAFRIPTTVAEAIGELTPRLVGIGALDVALEDLRQLLAVGILRSGQTRPEFSGRPYPLGGYDSPGLQIKLLEDRVRRSAFLRAISETIRPGDVVLDLGTGNGILAVAAVKAGARHVYAVEPGRVSALARQVFADNGVADRITLIEGWSQDTTLPERADVLTCDLVGFEGLDLRLPEITIDAVNRLLVDEPRLIPRRLNFGFYLAEVDDSLLNEHQVNQAHIARWNQWYGIDFSALLRDGLPSVYVHPETVRRLRALTDLQILWEADLTNGAGFPWQGAEVEFPAVPTCKQAALIGVVQAQLSKTVWMSTRPETAGASPHWLTPVWLPVPMQDRTVKVRYQYHGMGRVEVQVIGNNGEVAKHE